MIITIDGPAASGKSSLAKVLAQKLDYYYLYTGLLYRALAYILVHAEHKLSLPVMLEEVQDLTPEDFATARHISYRYLHNQPHVYHHGIDITAHLTDTRLDQPASVISAYPEARRALLLLQREIAQKHNTIADGRDCGSVVFPDADIKFFLTADVDTRARRLMADQTRGNHEKVFEKVKAALIERDERDRTRAESPLVIPEGAIIVDNSTLTFDQTVDEFLKEIEKRCGL
jgi:CMP/dCMP kinase